MDRINYCRLGFILLCVVPTLATGSAVTLRHVSLWPTGSQSSWEAELSRQLGFKVSVAKISRPHFGTILLEVVELADRETGKLVARARLVEAAQTEQGTVLVLSQPEIHVDELSSLAGTFHETLLRAGELNGTVHVVAGELTLRAPSTAQTFAGVECEIESLATGPRAIIRFRLPENRVAEPAQLIVNRRRVEPRPSTRWELHTGGEPLPCSVLVAYLPPLAMLGSDAQFHGVAWGEETATGWQGDVTGSLSNVNLDELVTQRFPHKLSGTADITFNRANFRQGRLVDASGTLEGRGGVIGPSLVLAAAEALELDAAPRVESLRRWPVRYERLVAGFAVSESGLALSGETDSPGTILSDREGPLFSVRPKHAVPVVSLVRALSPASEVQVPATAETDALLRALPIPPFAPSREPSRPPGTTVRLRD